MGLHEQYTDARQYLESVKWIKAEAKQLWLKAHDLRAQCESITAPLKDSPVANGGKDPHGDSTMVALADITAKLEQKTHEWLRRMDEVDGFIDHLPNPAERIILRLRYVDGLAWDEVERKLQKFGLYYSDRQIYRLHGQALQSARRQWNKEMESNEDRNSEEKDQ